MKKVTLQKTVSINNDTITMTEEVIIQPAESPRTRERGSPTVKNSRCRKNGERQDNHVVIHINNNNGPINNY